MRWLAIDFGERRVGLAISDAEGRFALPFATLARTNDAQIVREIAAIVEGEEIERVALGEPLLLDGSGGPAAERVRRFAARLETAVGVPVELVPETLTSHEAEARLRAAGVDPRRSPGRVDQVAAQLLLEEVLARREVPP